MRSCQRSWLKNAKCSVVYCPPNSLEKAKFLHDTWYNLGRHQSFSLPNTHADALCLHSCNCTTLLTCW